MKTEISRDSYQPKKRYSGVYQQQGRMLTDADWNELVEILKERLNDGLKDVVGNGSPLHRNVVNNETDPPNLQWGYVHVDGIQGVVRPDEGATLQPAFEYDHQEDFPEGPDLPSTPDDNFIYYADVWERTVTHLMDERLRDKGLHGADTCTRKQTIAQVKWCPYDTGNPANPDNDPEQSAKNPVKGDAELSLTLLQKTTEPDPCDPCAAQLDVESKVGNYLFRVEVHHVIGDANDPSDITLKWSSENAAEQYALNNITGDDVEPPAKFKSGQWAYEFFDETSERHLGVHLAPGFTPSRDELTEGYPAAVPARSFVRRWDGFCRLEKNVGSWEVADEFDRSQSGPGPVSFAEIAGGKLTVNLDALKLELKLNHSFVAGDYWLAEVREAEDEVGSELIVKEPPHGIEHHYLTLGTVEGGVLQPNPEADRKYAFPPLTEMTRMFMAGGDGQEVMPGQPLPQPLRVGVANGEWPVEGATVRFQAEAVDGSLTLLDVVETNDEGIAEYKWTPGTEFDAFLTVKATLIDPDHVNDPTRDMDPPVYFSANLITADQVAYEPGCPVSGENAVHSCLVADPAVSLDLGSDDYYTVKEVLDALLCKLRAKHIPYDVTGSNATRWHDVNLEEDPTATPPETVQEAIDDLLANLHSEDITYPLPPCNATPYGADTLKRLLEAEIQARHDADDDPDRFRIRVLLDVLLCNLDAEKLPYNSTLKGTRWDDINLEEGDLPPTTVQEALDDLVDNLQSEDIKYTPNCPEETLPTVRSELGVSNTNPSRIHEVLNKLLCDFKATHLPMDRSADLCDKLKNDAQVKTVQDAINALCLQSPRDAGCWVYVNVDTPLSEAIEKLLEQNHTDICISLMPGTHELPEGYSLLDGHGISVRITGCCADTRLLLGPKPIHFRGLDSVEISNMKIQGNAETACLVKIDSCRNVLIREIEAAARVAENGTILETNVPGSFRLENCVLEAFVPKSFEMPLIMFSNLDPDLENLFKSTDLVKFDEILKKQARRLAQLDPGEKKDLAGKIENRIQELAEMSDREASSYRSLIRGLLPEEENEAAPAEYSAHLKNIRIEAARANPGAAVALLDLASDVIIAKNNIAGIVSLYGLPGKTALSAGERETLIRVREETRLKNLRFVGSAGSLRSHDNVVNRFTIGEGKVDEVKNMIADLKAGTQAELKNLYKTGYFRDNEIATGDNMFLFQNLELNATVFQAPSGEVGLALSSRAVYIGNQAAHSVEDLRLLNITRRSNDAGNLMLVIAPPSP